MDQRKCEEVRNKVLDFKCKKIVHEVEKLTASSPDTKKPGLLGIENLENKFVSQTPEKTSQPLLTKSEDGEVEHQERYKTFTELFDAVVCSLRLLGLRKKSLTFQNVRAQVEALSQRELQHRHIAQIKYILPEAIQIEKILVHDKRTLCMKPDMKIMLLFDVVEGHNDNSDFTALRGVFASRVIDYFTKHPEVCDCPKAALPYPFNQQLQSAPMERIGELPEAKFSDPLCQTSQSIAAEKFVQIDVLEDCTSTKNMTLTNSSHLHPSFRRQLSQKYFVSEENVKLLPSPLPLLSLHSDDLNNKDITVSSHEDADQAGESRTGEAHGQSPKFDSVTNRDIKADKAKESPSTLTNSTFIDLPPNQPTNHEFSSDTNTSASPVCKSVSSADKLMIETPAQSVPKRAMPSCDDKHKAIGSQKQTPSHTSAKKSLDFSCSEDDKHMSDGYSLHGSNTPNLPGSTVPHQKVKESLGFPSEHHKKILSDAACCLPDLVSLINHIFQSANSSSMTKEELLHKIIANSFDFVNRGEVEEQLMILEKQVPEWLCRKLAPSGAVLYNITKVSDLESVRDRVINI